MNYHLFQKDSQSVFSKKIKSKSKSQNRERMSWTLYNFPLHCIVSYEVCIYQNFTTKVACICIPKNYVNCIDFLHLMSKSCGFGMTGPLDESISCFLIKVDPWVLVPITFRGLYVLAIRGLHILSCRGLHALAFRGLRVLIFSVLHIHALEEYKVLCP